MDPEKVRSQAADMIDNAYQSCEIKFEVNHSGHNLEEPSTVRLNTMMLVESGEIYENIFQVDSNRVPNLTNKSDFIKLAYEAFDFIPMSPHRYHEHKLTYQIDSGDRTYNDIEHHINVSENIIINQYDKLSQDFIELLISKARKLVDDEISMRLCKYIIVGDPGVGKTAFINYLFSINCCELIKNKVIWIRVDLNKATEPDLTLKDRMHYKFLRIFCNEYFKNDEYIEDSGFREFDALSQFQDDLLCLFKLHLASEEYFNLTKIEKDHIAINYIKLMNHLINRRDKNLDHDIKYDHYDIDRRTFNNLTGRLISYLQETYGYAFIFIFDGLDSVVIDFIQYPVYDSWLTEILDIVNRKEFKSVYLITMRIYSYLRFSPKLKNEAIKFKKLQINKHKIDNIFDSKIKLLFAKMQDKYAIPEDQMVNIKYNLYNIMYYVIQKPSVYELLKISYDDKIDNINKIFGFNYRAMFRFIRELILVVSGMVSNKDPRYSLLNIKPGKGDIIDNISGKDWLLMRLFLFGNVGNHVYRNRIEYNQNGDARIGADNRAIIPNLFNYYDYVTNDDEDTLPRALVKIRIIQFIKDNPHSYVFEVIKWLISRIDPRWNSQKLQYEIREMIYNNLIRPQELRENEYLSEKKLKEGNYKIYLTELGEYIMEFLNKVVYYETVIDDTPINRKYATEMEALNSFDIKFTNNLGEYLKIKTKSVINYLLYLNKIESIEKVKMVKEEHNISDNDYLAKYSIFNNKRIQLVKGDMIKYLFGYLKSMKSSALPKFIVEWYDHFDVPQEKRKKIIY